MTRRGKVVLAVLVVSSVLGLVAATNAWFVAVSNTPPGKISSALVRYLPEAGTRPFSSILEYGNLISGSGVDPDGVPLVLPGDRLTASATVDAAGTQTIRTSIAREFQAGETVDTVIHWEIRTQGGVEVTRKQRDVMNEGTPTDQWWKDGSFLGDGVAPDPMPTSARYDIITTNEETVVKAPNDDAPLTTTTTTIVTTTYTPRLAAEPLPAYVHKVTTVKVITHEAASYTPTTYTDASWAAIPIPRQYINATETVLFSGSTSSEAAPANSPTRSYVVINYIGAGGTATAETETLPIPLTLGNLSTVETNVRVGLNARLTNADGTDGAALTLKGPIKDVDDNFYFGATLDGIFVELIVFRPYAGEGYAWTAVKETPEAVGKTSWGLWDLTLSGKTAVPPAVTPDTPPSISPGASLSPTPTPSAEPTPVKYTVTDRLGVVSKRPAQSDAATDAEFEVLFNQLYCTNAPIITVHLSYYARQSEFMDWTEFYTQELTLNMSDYAK